MTARRHAAAFAALFAGLALALFLLNGWNAYQPRDDGFILAYSWRLAQGEVPYRDFLYVRTPLTPYLHYFLLLLPEGWQIQTGRLTYYAELALSGALPAMWAALRLGVRATPRSLGLAAIGFLFAVHNFAPMPWPTVDGVLFASAGATAFLFSLDGRQRSALILRAGASVLVALAVLSKQTFAPIAVLLVAFAVIEAIRVRRVDRLIASALPGAAVGLAVLGLIGAAGALPQFLQQIGEPAALRAEVEGGWTGDPLVVGVLPYLSALSPVALVPIGLAFALAWWRDARGRRASLLRKAGSAGLFAAFAALAVEAQWDTWRAGIHLFWLLVGAFAGLALRASDRTDRLTVAGFFSMLAIGWCASLSFAYQTPLLGLAGAGVLLERAFPRTPWPAERLAVAIAVVFVAVGIGRLQLDRPYELPRAAQTADLGEIYPRFGRLYTNEVNYARFRELRELSARHATSRGEPFVVIPDFPLVYYLAGVRNPISVDWVQPQEYLGNEERVLEELVTRRPVVLIFRDPSPRVGPAPEPPPCERPPAPVSDLTAYVVSRWVLLDQGRHFCVYRAPP